jgi:hypothetical protein
MAAVSPRARGKHQMLVPASGPEATDTLCGLCAVHALANRSPARARADMSLGCVLSALASS